MAGARFHPRYSGSNAHRFMPCAGQVRLAATLPDIETEHSIEGTFGHAVVEAAIRNGLTDATIMAGVYKIGDRWVDQETAEAAQHVVDYVELLKREYPDIQIVAESARNVLGYPFEFAGCTSDVIWWSASAKKAGYIDYKHGAGERVDADDNKQLMFGLWGEFALQIAHFDYLGTIIQPRHWAYQGPREQKFLWADLFDFSLDLDAAIAAAEKPDAELTPGSWCKNCKAAAVCPALERHAREVLLYSNVPLAEIDYVRLAFIVEHASEARQWLKACEDFALRQALQGVHIPGMKLVPGSARRRYRPDLTPDQISAKLQEIVGPHRHIDSYQIKLKPLTEIEKLLVQTFRDAVPPEQKDAAAAQARAAFAFLTLRDTTNTLSLVPETDPRPAHNPGLGDFEGVVIDHIA